MIELNHPRSPDALPATEPGRPAAQRWRADRVLLGCDYNPEQWPREVWEQDVRLMREVGVGLVAVNVFGWAEIQPGPQRYDFARLDEVVELLHDHGIGINLGTGTASPPPWLTTAYPQILPVAEDGTTRWPGGRQAWCPSSPVFREHSLALVDEVARRYGQHPALRLWHVNNELGCHNGLCYCDVSAEAFRGWLRERYVDIEGLNAAWGTSFWSQRYGAFEEVLPPRLTLSTPNPSQVLDYRRFSSDELLAQHLAESEVIRRHSGIPVTTNMMVTSATSTTGPGPRTSTSSPTTTTSTTGSRTLRPSSPSAPTSPAAWPTAGRGCSWSTRRAPSTGSRSTWPRRPGSCCGPR